VKLRDLRVAVISICLLAPSVQAAYVLNVTQSGSNVVANGSGTLNLTALSVTGTVGSVGAFINSQFNDIAVGPFTASTSTYGPLPGAAPFGSVSGSPSNANASTSSGTWTLIVIGTGNVGGIGVPTTYTSGTSISATATWNSTTIAGLGLSPGSYVYRWGTGTNADSFTVNIGAPVTPTTTPIPSSLYLLGVGMIALGGWYWLAAARRRTL